MSWSPCTALIVLNGGVLSYSFITLVLSTGVEVFASSDRDVPCFQSMYVLYMCDCDLRTVTLFPQYLPKLHHDDCACCCCCFRHCWRAHDSGSLSSNWHGWWRLLTPSVDRARSSRLPPSTWRPSPATPPPARSTPLTRSAMPLPARCKSIAPLPAAVTIRTFFCLKTHCLAYGNNGWSV